MVTMHLAAHVATSPVEAWNVLADIGKAAERIEGIKRIEILTEGPIGVGTRWHETRVMMKKEVTEEMEITAWDPESHYTVQSDSCGSHFVWTTRVVAAGEGSTLSMDIEIKARTFMAKLMTPLTWLMSGIMKKCVLKDLEDIKTYLESAAAEEQAEA